MTLLPLSAALSLPAIAAASYHFPMFVRQIERRRLRQRCASTRSLVLTYDDGPGEDLTPDLLRLLATRAARATFFLTGRRAADHPELVEAIVRGGHEVGCHTHEHLHPWRIAPHRAVADIHQGYDVLRTWIKPDAIFRPPYGKLTLPTWLALRRRRASVGWWTITGGDVRRTLPAPDRAAQRARRDNGGVVLLHDFHRAGARAEFVLDATQHLLDAANRCRWTVRTLSEVFALKTARAA
jgi:peptidoglycan/xylan/chitin deacetylase (PgdA/CDA1 family)